MNLYWRCVSFSSRKNIDSSMDTNLCLHVFMCTTYVPGAHGKQKKALEMELQIQIVVSHHVDAEDWT